MKINLFPTRVGLIAATAVLLNVASWAAVVSWPGYAKVENFDGINGDPVANLTAAAKYINNQPDSITFIDRLIWNRNPAQDNYGSRISGYITPLETAEYVFFVAADNGISMYLSTDSTPANLRLIAADQGWQGNFTWTGPGGVLANAGTTNVTYHRGRNPGPTVLETNGYQWVGPFENRSDEFLNSPRSNLATTLAQRWPVTNSAGNAVITLTNGTRYYYQMLFKEGGGGDNSSVGWTTAANLPNVVNGDQLLVVGPEVLSMEWPDAVSFAVNPTNITTQEGHLVNFVSVALGVPGDSDVATFTYQWYVNDEAIIDGSGNAATLTIPIPTIADNGKRYKVVVTTPNFLTATSAEATLTVISDTTAPRIARVRTLNTFLSAKITFSEAVDLAAIDPANYVFSGGLTATDANFDIVTGGEDPKNPTNPLNRVSVILTTSLQTTNEVYNLTINNVKDGIGNALSPNTTMMYANRFQPGILAYERWNGGNNINTLVTTPLRFANPTATETRTAGEMVNQLAGNYVDRLSGFFIPQVTTNYVFFMSADNNGILYLSTDSDPVNRKMIAAEPNWQNNRTWTGNGSDANKRRGETGAGLPPYENRSDQMLTSARALANTGVWAGLFSFDFLDPEPWPVLDATNNAFITLEAGTRYHIQLWHTEGDSGRAEMTFKYIGENNTTTEPDPANGTVSRMSGAWIGAYVDPTSLLPAITTQPANVNFTIGGTIAFTVIADSFIPATYQWFKEGTALPNQTNATLTINNATLADIGSYHVTVVNENGTTTSVQAAALTPVAAPGKSYQQDGTGLTVVEAEHYYAATAGTDGKVWVPSSRRADASGGSYITVLPDTGGNAGNALTITSTVARVDFRINFATTGTNYVWIRGGDPRVDGAGDSAHVGIDGELAASGLQISGAPTFNTATWNWVGNVQAATRTFVVVNSTGLHDVSIWVREDGFLADKILLTTDVAFTPTGTGPAESLEDGGTPPPTISAARNGAGQLVITYTGTLVSSTTVNGTYTAVAGASGGSHTVTIPTTGNVFYQATPAAP